MKNQYFGDINDYRKYGLIRLLADSGVIRTGICWMLTPDDTSTDGRFTKYLDEPEEYKKFDPDLYDFLGHKTLQMVKRYSHLSEDHKADVLEKMNKKVFG